MIFKRLGSYINSDNTVSFRRESEPAQFLLDSIPTGREKIAYILLTSSNGFSDVKLEAALILTAASHRWSETPMINC